MLIWAETFKMTWVNNSKCVKSTFTIFFCKVKDIVDRIYGARRSERVKRFPNFLKASIFQYRRRCTPIAQEKSSQVLSQKNVDVSHRFYLLIQVLRYVVNKMFYLVYWRYSQELCDPNVVSAIEIWNFCQKFWYITLFNKKVIFANTQMWFGCLQLYRTLSKLQNYRN